IPATLRLASARLETKSLGRKLAPRPTPSRACWTKAAPFSTGSPLAARRSLACPRIPPERPCRLVEGLLAERRALAKGLAFPESLALSKRLALATLSFCFPRPGLALTIRLARRGIPALEG